MTREGWFKIYNRNHRLTRDDVKDENWENLKHKFYGNRKIDWIFIIYIITIIGWGLIIWYLKPTAGLFILFIPFIVFLISIFSLHHLSVSVENEMFAFDYLSTGLLVILPLLSCILNNYKGNRTQMVRVLLLAITFTILSLVDVWVPEKYLSMTKHIRSIFQTISLTLILYALYIYYDAMGDFPATKLVPDS